MLDRLPPEILDAILVLTYPPSPWPDKDDADWERRQSLITLSLVCRAVRPRAQALLWRKVHIRHPRNFNVLRPAVNRKTVLNAEVRTVRWTEGGAFLELFPVLAFFPGMKKLQAGGGGLWANWEDLSKVPLRTLEVDNIEIFVLPRSRLHPPSFVRLSLTDVKISQRNASRILNSELLPNLKVLEISHWWDGPTRFFPPVSPHLADQLDLLHLHLVDATPSSDLLSLPTTVLVSTAFRLDLKYTFNGQLAHLRLLASSFNVLTWVTPQLPLNEVVTSNLADLTIFIQSSSHLRTLQLPAFLNHVDPVLSPTIIAQRDILLKACAASNLEVSWLSAVEGSPDFPRAFWAYVKRLQAKKALAADEAAVATTSGSA